MNFLEKRTSMFDLPRSNVYKNKSSILNSNLVPDKMNLIDILKDFSCQKQKKRKIDKIFTEKKTRRNNFSIMNYTSKKKDRDLNIQTEKSKRKKILKKFRERIS